ncbi:MAG: sugar transferase [Pirellulaceae bacterium]|nr:sugar transferase [Pirellulaceae bacterium]
MTAGAFNREIARERIRATRRAFPFCIITIELVGNQNRRRRKRSLIRLLHRHLRMTDQKGILGPAKFGVLLVDTPEMGGRVVVDRLTLQAERLGLNVKLDLKVHDPDGFDPDDFPPSGNRRHGDDLSQRWLRVDDANVSVSAEDPMVPRPMMRMAVKRLVDISGALVGLTVGSPLIVGGMLMVKLTSPGPALFTQTREGLRGKPFKIYKLRTMVVDAESQQANLQSENHRDGPAFKITKDPRVTTAGDFLRSTCIDELPQLWNVLKGDMSLVGPRPLPWHESRACNPWHRRRLDVKPGMTCNWQVNKANATSFDEWMRMDLQYVDRIGLIRDLRLIMKTFVVPLTGRGSE